MKFNFHDIKKKYFIESDFKIAIANTDEIKSLILTVEDQAETLNLYKKELQKAKDEYITLSQSIAEADTLIEQYQLHEKYLLERIKKQTLEIKELRRNARTIRFFEIAEENLKLAQEIDRLKGLLSNGSRTN